MKVYAVTIKPESPFGTPIKGDTLFGQFCWQVIAQDEMLDGGFEFWIKRYPDSPFAVFSSAWPKIHNHAGAAIYCFPKPALPVIFPDTMSRKDRAEARKLEKAKKWILVKKNRLSDIAASAPINDSVLFEKYLSTLSDEKKRFLQYLPESKQKPVISANRSHNSINRLTMTTGKGFDPFSMDVFHYLPGLELVVFAAIDEDALDSGDLCSGLERIGRFGYGRDASTGLGRFCLSEIEEIDWPQMEKGAGCFTLAPCVPEQNRFCEQFSIPFTRFGKHGDQLVLSKNPFKNPIVMADEGAVFYPDTRVLPDKPYIGTGITGLSVAEKSTVAQGYGLYLPFSRSAS